MNLTVERLTKRLGGRPVVDEVSLTCGDAEAVVLLGDNGAGKTTLLKMVVGIIIRRRARSFWTAARCMGPPTRCAATSVTCPRPPARCPT